MALRFFVAYSPDRPHDTNLGRLSMANYQFGLKCGSFDLLIPLPVIRDCLVVLVNSGSPSKISRLELPRNIVTTCARCFEACPVTSRNVCRETKPNLLISQVRRILTRDNRSEWLHTVGGSTVGGCINPGCRVIFMNSPCTGSGKWHPTEGSPPEADSGLKSNLHAGIR
jgi:hypothetical protein